MRFTNSSLINRADLLLTLSPPFPLSPRLRLPPLPVPSWTELQIMYRKSSMVSFSSFFFSLFFFLFLCYSSVEWR